MIATDIYTVLVAIGAGLASVLSPCVLPVVPIVMAGAEGKDRLRPLLLVAGLAVAFMVMGAASALFGDLLVGRTRSIELAGSFIILVMGLMVIFDISIFKKLNFMARLPVKGEGRIGGFLLGMALGVVWVPCIGPFLSSILTKVGTSGQVVQGITLLGFYSFGLAMPMLLLGYSSHLVQTKIKALVRHERLLRYVSGGILVIFGIHSTLRILPKC